MGFAEATNAAGTVRILWDLSAIERTVSEYFEEANEQLSEDSTSEASVALDFIDFGLIGRFQITAAGLRLFRAGPGDVAATDMPVLRVLLGLHEAISHPGLVVHTLHCADEDWVVVREHNGLVRLTSQTSLSAPRADWVEALDVALAQLRSWLNEFVPKSRTNAVLGLWLMGGALPAFSSPLAQEGEVLM